MSVNVGQRNVPDNPQNRQLEACEKAMELAMHTIKLCVNENVFVKEYQSALTYDIIRTAKDIYINAWSGNNVYVNSKERWTERERYQLTAITKCNELLALINNKLIQRMDKYYHDLWRENYESKQTNNNG